MSKRVLPLVFFVLLVFSAGDAYAVQYPDACKVCKFTVMPVLQMPQFYCDYPQRNTWGYTECEVGFLGLSCDTGFDLCYYIEISPT